MKVKRPTCDICNRPLFWLGWIDLGVVTGVYICHACDRRR